MTRRAAAVAGLLLAFAAVAIVAIAIWPESAGNGDEHPGSHGSRSAATGLHSTQSIGTLAAGLTTAERPGDARFALQAGTEPPAIRYRFKHPPLAGVLFDVKTGQVLWQRNPGMKRPIASLTKMMTALMIARTDPPDNRVKVSRNAAHTQGSATGVLPRGRKVPLEALLEALILI